jgi:hypothetical protein
MPLRTLREYSWFAGFSRQVGMIESPSAYICRKPQVTPAKRGVRVTADSGQQKSRGALSMSVLGQLQILGGLPKRHSKLCDSVSKRSSHFSLIGSF